MTIEQMKQEVCQYAKQSYAEKLFAGTSGNLSVYYNGVIVITPTSIAYETITPEDMVVIQPDGAVLEGKHAPSSEWRMHAAIYRLKPEVHAVIHTHSPYATAFAVNNAPIPAIMIEMVPFLGGDVPLAAFALPGTDALGIEAVKVLSDRYACLLANHGTLAVGDTLTRAHTRSIYLEDSAKICSIAIGNGAIKTISPEHLAAMRG